MAFPTIQTADTKNGTVTTNSTSWTLTYPTNLVSGDLILALVATDGSTTASTFPANWVNYTLADATGAVTAHCGLKISDGTETGSFTFSCSASEQGGWRVFRITGWFGSGIGTGGAFSAGFQLDNTGTSFMNARGATANPNPGSDDPTNWATEDTLWFATCHVDTSRTISVFPLASNNSSDVSGGSTGATLGVCTTNSAVSSLDPGTFTISASDDWVSLTIAIRPAVVASLLLPNRLQATALRR